MSALVCRLERLLGGLDTVASGCGCGGWVAVGVGGGGTGARPADGEPYELLLPMLPYRLGDRCGAT